MMKNIELENTVLSCMILDKNCSIEWNILDKDDFSDYKNLSIFEGIQSLVQNNKPVDYLMLYEELNQEISISYLSELNEFMPSTLNFREYVRELKDLSLKRKLIELGRSLYDKNKSGKELIEYAEKQIFALAEKEVSGEFVDIKNIVLDAYEDIEKRYMGNELEGVITGYAGLDKMTDGFKKKNLIYLAGRPSMGKTALALNIAEKNVLSGNSVAVFSLEMGKEELVKRMLKGISMVSFEKLQAKKMEEKDWQRMIKAASLLLEKRLFIDDTPSLTVSEMTSMCRKLKREKGLDMVIIDYLQLINTKTRQASRREEIDIISRSLKAMAKELDLPVIVISSLSRAVEQRNSKVPLISDLRESGQIEYDADLVIFVHREEYYNPTNENQGKAQVIIAKQRNGKLGIVRLNWLGEYTRFVDMGCR